MSHRHLWSETQLAIGDRAAALGVLEDMRRVYDGLPARPTLPSHSERPYLGPNSRPHSAGAAVTIAAGAALAQPRGILRRTERVIERPLSPPPELRGPAASPARMASPAHLSLAPERFATSTARGGSHADALPQPSAPAPSLRPTAGPGSPMLGGSDASALAGSVPSQGYLLSRWLATLGVRMPSPFALDGAVLTEFTDGTLLCDIVGRLEHRALAGVTRKPRSSAASLHNINKALEALRLRKVCLTLFPPPLACSVRLTWIEESQPAVSVVRRGDSAWRACCDLRAARAFAPRVRTRVVWAAAEPAVIGRLFALTSVSWINADYFLFHGLIRTILLFCCCRNTVHSVLPPQKQNTKQKQNISCAVLCLAQDSQTTINVP
jgi:hypothetical protein